MRRPLRAGRVRVQIPALFLCHFLNSVFVFTSRLGNLTAQKFFFLMKKFFLIACIAAFAASANAQNDKGQWSFAPTVGLNLSKINEEGWKMKPGVAAGINAEYGVSEKFGLSAGLFYSMEGAKMSEGRIDFKAKMNYVNIPIMANYYVWNGLAVKAGIQPGFLTTAKMKAEGFGASAEEDFKKECNTFHLAIPIGISYEFKNIVLDARYAFGVTNYAKDSEEACRNSTFQISLAYKFKR